MKKDITRLLGSICMITLLSTSVAHGQTMPEKPVGKEPRQDGGRTVAIFEERGVLTSKGTFIVEPSLQYLHSSSSRVAIEGFSVIPAITIGLINVSELQRDTFIGALAFRYGLTTRLEVEAKIPYVYRDESIREREFSQPSSSDIIQNSEGNDLGDIEFAIHYQLNRGKGGFPYLVANIRVKSRTGNDPFEVEREILQDSNGTEIGEVFKEQPTGSGFWGVQPSLTIVYPTDPAVLYANISYLWNIERNVGDGFGRIDPGDAVGVSFGLGFAINDKTSFSLGYDHSTILKSSFSNSSGTDAQFDQIQIGTFLVGLSQRLTKKTTFNLSLGMGVTDEASDLQLTMRFPISF